MKTIHFIDYDREDEIQYNVCVHPTNSDAKENDPLLEFRFCVYANKYDLSEFPKWLANSFFELECDKEALIDCVSVFKEAIEKDLPSLWVCGAWEDVETYNLNNIEQTIKVCHSKEEAREFLLQIRV